MDSSVFEEFRQRGQVDLGMLSDVQFGEVKAKSSRSDNGVGQRAGVGNPRKAGRDEITPNAKQFITKLD